MTHETGSLSIYSELLTNIRHVSVVVTLPGPPDATTTVRVLEEGKKIRVSHGEALEETLLPGRVSGPSVLPLQVTPGREGCLTWRLPLSPSVSSTARHEIQLDVPWAAHDLIPSSLVSCRECNGTLVPAGKLAAWKDLPSENWAEMMDFWHCHKPHVHTNDHSHGNGDEHLVKRGYGANSSISAQPTIGFVDLTSFLFAESDCENLIISTSDTENGRKTSWDTLHGLEEGPAAVPRMLFTYCSGCLSHIGFFNVSISSVVLFKWKVNCETLSVSPRPTSSGCLASALLASLARSGSAKSIIVPTVPNNKTASTGINERSHPALHVWILNGDIKYVSSGRDGGPQSAIKLLYRTIPLEEADKMLESFSSDVQDINFPPEAIENANQALSESTLLLPSADRNFGNWQVGLLDRWTG